MIFLQSKTCDSFVPVISACHTERKQPKQASIYDTFSVETVHNLCSASERINRSKSNSSTTAAATVVSALR